MSSTFSRINSMFLVVSNQFISKGSIQVSEVVKPALLFFSIASKHTMVEKPEPISIIFLGCKLRTIK